MQMFHRYTKNTQQKLISLYGRQTQGTMESHSMTLVQLLYW